MNVVLYMRYSSDRQTEQSIEGQNRVCEEFCKRQGYTIIAKYIDRATSAFKDTDKRSQFQQMIKDSSKGTFEGVVVYKLDRFARNRYDSATYKTKLKRNGVRLISATEVISENPEGIILESVLEGMAEFYSTELSQKVKRGMNESAIKFHSLGGQPLLGYKFVDKKYVIDEKTAPIVKQAFELYANDVPIVEICERFNKLGYKTSKGASFNKSSFATMFRNERYIGTYIYNGVKTPNAIPPIIDKELFDKVKKKLDIVKKAPSRGKAKVEYLLSGKIFCGKCGAAMHGTPGTSKTGKVYHYYVCFNQKKKLCDKKSNDKDLIEKSVVEDTYKLLTPDTIDKIADIAVEESLRQANNEGKIRLLEDKLKDISLRLKNLTRGLELAPEVDELTYRIKELKMSQKEVQEELDKEKNSIIILDKEQVVWWLNQFLDGDIKDIEFQKKLINLLVNRVEVFDGDGNIKLRITYNCVGHNDAYKGEFGLDAERSAISLEKQTLFCVDTYFIIERSHPSSR